MEGGVCREGFGKDSKQTGRGGRRERDGEGLLDMKEVCYLASVGSGTVALGMISAALGVR